MEVYYRVITMEESKLKYSEDFYKKIMYLAIISGILLLISGGAGVSTFESLKQAVLDNFDSEAIALAFTVLILLASFGGLLVILGGVWIGKKEEVEKGTLFIKIGMGVGLIGLIIILITALLGNGVVIAASSTTIAGIGLSFIAWYMVKE